MRRPKLKRPPLADVQRAVALVACNYRLVLHDKTLWLAKPRGAFGPDTVANLRPDHRWLAVPGIEVGGTTEQAICQLLCWYRGYPRVPWWGWANWFDAGLCNQSIDAAAKLSDVLRDESPGAYSDPPAVACVLCGKAPVGLDWWSLDGVVGPCCAFGRAGSCRQREG